MTGERVLLLEQWRKKLRLLEPTSHSISEVNLNNANRPHSEARSADKDETKQPTKTSELPQSETSKTPPTGNAHMHYESESSDL